MIAIHGLLAAFSEMLQPSLLQSSNTLVVLWGLQEIAN